MVRIVAVGLVLAIAVTGWIGFEQHRRAQVRQADADAAIASANEALAAARARIKPAPVWAVEPMPAPTSPSSMPPAVAPAPGLATFACDGRTHCSQMHSCAEAQYFLAHCPGVKMDGNHDGEPCEQQFPECGR